MNRIRVFTSGAFFLFAIYCLMYHPELPFQQPTWVYVTTTLYFAYFPIKDMMENRSHSLYKGRQFKKNYLENPQINEIEFKLMKHKYNIRACWSMVFWLCFMSVPGFLYLHGYIDRIWIFLFFALSNFSVFFAIFGWCPFHSIFIKPECCMECRIYNWDSFFQYSFLIFIPNIYTIILFSLGVISLLEWEITHALYPKRFYKMSNDNLTCKNCDLENCRKHKKKMFHTTLKEEYQDDWG